MMRGFFITGTDTNVGKTWVTAGLLHAFNEQGLRTIAMKPVASGCETIDGQLRNADAECLMKHMNTAADYQEVNPYSFEPAIAPHIAAKQAGENIDLEKIQQTAEQLARRADVILVEGVGGWAVPLNETQAVADLAVKLQLPVIMVVSIRLGCLNHALLSAQSIRASGLSILGWVANMCDSSDSVSEENIFALQQRLDCPMLAKLPLLNEFDIKKLSSYFDPERLIT
ncbi:MAG: dethiobiotin synthase [Halobacteria archaeon]|nr:dethiobiotin synthase [Halobacteria archaeon]